MKVVRHILTVLAASNLEELWLLGRIPRRWGLGAVLSGRGAEQLTAEPPLGGRVRGPRVLLVLIGIGTPGGFQVAEDSRRPAPVLPEDWWSCEGIEVHLVAFCCHSFQYLGDSDISRWLAGAIAYEGEIWVSTEAGEFWKSFVARLAKGVREVGAVGHEALGRVFSEYGDALAGRGFWKRTKPDYITQLSLAQQSMRVRLVEGEVL